jgi:hypothetical protein
MRNYTNLSIFWRPSIRHYEGFGVRPPQLVASLCGWPVSVITYVRMRIFDCPAYRRINLSAVLVQGVLPAKSSFCLRPRSGRRRQSSTGFSRRRVETCSRFKRVVLVLRMLRRPSIAPVVRPNVGPIIKRGLPAATSSRGRLSSSGVHRLLLFFGIACWED